MKKSTRLWLAQNTLKIIEDGYYFYENNNIEIKEQLKESCNETVTISPNEWKSILQKPIVNFETKAILEVINCTTIEAILNKSLPKTAILNFASAKNPGGGFKGGASAQEESLARSSSLHKSLTKDFTMYNYNRNQTSFLYSDYMIYSPNTVFWFDDEGNTLLKPVLVDVITSPAPNKGAMIQHNRNDEMKLIETTFLKRIDYLLHYAHLQKVECMILGAWGCGVFKNNPVDVANYFKKVIDDKYSYAFKKIIFAVYDSSENKSVFNAFQNVLL